MRTCKARVSRVKRKPELPAGLIGPRRESHAKLLRTTPLMWPSLPAPATRLSCKLVKTAFESPGDSRVSRGQPLEAESVLA